MALPTNTAGSWMQSLDLPSRLFGEGGFGGSDYELYEENGEFVLSVDLAGFETEEFEVTWDDGVLNVAAEHVDEGRGRKRTYHRRFRFPKEIDEDEISASYTNGVLEVTLPAHEDAVTRGKTIPVEG
ncbi:Hsp20/alpha crystallin family protein [Halobacterium yunchengense]|uniref:Hsp20/alpha crystallin family protein n=1 Tax=Halobacterium yunchengense TaxID=3108497 RepID=UPI00300AFA33